MRSQASARGADADLGEYELIAGRHCDWRGCWRRSLRAAAVVDLLDILDRDGFATVKRTRRLA